MTPPLGEAPDSTTGTGKSLRELLRRLRAVMKSAGNGQERLDRLVGLVADHMAAEVCSLYVLRAGAVLELFATRGLRPDAVHRTRLDLGEGLVGDIAAEGRPLALADAQSHPKFAYRPETGEEVYGAFCGVPVQRDGQVLGVIAVQNVHARAYAEEEIEALETVAMMLGESLAAGELGAPAETGPARLDCATLNEGVAIGTAVLHGHGIAISRLLADDPARETARLEAAVADMQAALDRAFAHRDLAGQGEHQAVLETFRMFADDRGWLARIREAIGTGLTAEAAVDKVLCDTRARMARVSDPYLRERLSDFNDLGTRLLRHLLGLEDQDDGDALPEDAVLIAGNLGPAELLDYDRQRLRAVVLTQGAHTSHVAIIARALGLPMVGGCRNALAAIRPGDPVIVDADSAQVLARPAPAVARAFRRGLEDRALRAHEVEKIRDLPAVTRDGARIGLFANAGLLIDLPQVRASGAEGIGLYRTEVPFMVRAALPDEDAQTALYARIFDEMDGAPIAFRTLDLGGDKAPAYWERGAEENAAMGWRGIRVGLDRPELLDQQLTALIRAASGRELAVMLPLVSEAGEIDRARAHLDDALARARAEGVPVPSRLSLGVMIEVPALLWQLDRVFARVDFVSLGSNDLLQFLFATDRGEPRLAGRYDVLSPTVLGLLRALAARAETAGKPITVCGEHAGRPLEAMALLGCGFRRLSMAPAHVGRVKMMVRSLDLGPLAARLDELIALDHDSLRAELAAYAEERGVALA